ncbi:hypothetical protein ABQE48_21350 [Mycolicibacterium thermoresistibile]
MGDVAGGDQGQFSGDTARNPARKLASWVLPGPPPSAVLHSTGHRDDLVLLASGVLRATSKVNAERPPIVGK